METLQFKPIAPQEVDKLREMAETTYRHTFAPHNTQADMDAYAAAAFGRDKLLKELKNPDCLFFFGVAGGEVVGFIKLCLAPSQSDVNDETSLEVERLYLLPEHQGKGYGGQFLQMAEDWAREAGKTWIWLGVWERNFRAQHLYQKRGFTRFGEHPFPMGEDIQTDYLLRKDLTLPEGAKRVVHHD